MPRYNNVHRQQLFHWIGAHIEADRTSKSSRPRDLDDRHRRTYLDCLDGALRHGLWLKTPRDPDQLGDGSKVKVTRPIVCFTEWSLHESLPHTTRYGRLGLGFAKRFVSERGGQPVAYVRDQKRGDPFTKALLDLVAAFRAGALQGPRATALALQLDYLSHFVKRNRALPKPRPAPVAKRRARKPKGAGATARRVAPVNLFERRFGRTLHYLEEREWRIVHDPSLEGHFHPGPRGGAPDWYLPFETGEHLFTVVLPDNRTVHMALQSASLRRRLFQKEQPHVSVLSLEDIGTF